MRLLRYSKDGKYGIPTDFAGQDSIPPYAILSHTRGKETDEVTFVDLVNGVGETKAYGYDKIRFCGEQAHRDGLEYFWIDTCCINKDTKAEHSLAIRSMFRWYFNSSRCYVYLPDVSVSRGGAGEKATKMSKTDFCKSRWFTRGWTLQELLAPKLVEFFSAEGTKIGDKVSLLQEIHEATNIPKAALQGAFLSQFTMNERLSWNEHRDTKIPVDRVYSLIGILGVDISPLDGETPAEAHQRVMDEFSNQVKCLRDLRVTDPHHDKIRIEETKGGLLKESYRWIFNNDSFRQWQNDSQSQLLWIKGDPGKGKTMLLCGIINELQDSIATNALLSYFFCQATDARINNALSVVRGLLSLTFDQQPLLASHVRKKYDQRGKTLFEDSNAWVALTNIFTNVLKDPSLGTTYLIIDALDECVNDLPELLEFIAKQASTSARVKWIVSSRNWPLIEEGLEQANKVKLSLELNAEFISKSVSHYIEQRVDYLVHQKKYDTHTRDAVLKHLTSNASDTFLWVALVCQNLTRTSRRHVLKKLKLFPPGLNALYERMIQQISDSEDDELCKHILALVTHLYRPVTMTELVALVEQFEDFSNDIQAIREIVDVCGSFLTLRKETVYFVHQSAQDFLLAAKGIFPSGAEHTHHTIFARSLEIMSRSLRRDMYSLRAFGFPIENVMQPVPDPLASLRYSCVYWIDHMCVSITRSVGLSWSPQDRDTSP